MARVLKNVLTASGLLAAGGAALYATADPARKFDLASRAGVLLRLLDPETAHNVGLAAARWGLFPRTDQPDPESLRVNVWGRSFPNPIGLAAGFDKDAEVMEPMMGLGFGFVEVGSITPNPQPGNPQPRAFRIPDLKAVINRYGFNSKGADAAAANLEAFTRKAEADSQVKPGVLAVNLGKNKVSEDAAGDYSLGLFKLGRFADFVVINISSPNTPGLRSLQGRQQLEDLLRHVKGTRDRLEWGPRGPPPLVVKIAPDLTEQDKADLAAVVTKLGVDGLVVSNTTISRPAEVAAHKVSEEAGGLSGPPLFEPSTQVLRDMYRLTGGKVPIIGCGGVASGEDAYKKIRAGASLVEVYTALSYQGPRLVPAIKQELADCLERDGFKSVQDAVGADHRRGSKQAGAEGKGKGWLW